MEPKTEKSFQKSERKDPDAALSLASNAQSKPDRPEITVPKTDSKPGRPILIAAISFSDAATGKSFKAGDIVDGWDESRIAHYIARGVVYRTTEVAPKEVK